MKSQNEDLLDR